MEVKVGGLLALALVTASGEWEEKPAGQQLSLQFSLGLVQWVAGTGTVLWGTSAAAVHSALRGRRDAKSRSEPADVVPGAKAQAAEARRGSELGGRGEDRAMPWQQ